MPEPGWAVQPLGNCHARWADVSLAGLASEPLETAGAPAPFPIRPAWAGISGIAAPSPIFPAKPAWAGMSGGAASEGAAGREMSWLCTGVLKPFTSVKLRFLLSSRQLVTRMAADRK